MALQPTLSRAPSHKQHSSQSFCRPLMQHLDKMVCLEGICTFDPNKSIFS